MSEQQLLDDLLAKPATTIAAQLIMPAIDLRPAGSNYQTEIEQLNQFPFYGYLIFGGETKQIGQMTRSFRRLAADLNHLRPIFASDLERGLGQIVKGGTLIPSLEAVQHSANPDHAAHKLAEIIALEALAIGIDAPFAPVLDLSDVAENPIVGTRSFNADPEVTARLGVAFVKAFEDLGLVSCGKHFPGHGGTIADSHDALPIVDYSKQHLIERDLLPFKRCAEAGMSSVMTAHVAYSSYSELPATLDAKLIQDLARERCQFDGLVITDAFIMDGVLNACGGDECQGAIAALKAGCDVVLYPKDAIAVAKAIAAEIEKSGVEWLIPSLKRIIKRKLKLPQIPDLEGLDETQSKVRQMTTELLTDCSKTPAPDQLTAFQTANKLNIVCLDDDATGSNIEIGLDLIAELQVKSDAQLHVFHLNPENPRLPNEFDSEAPCLVVIRCSIRAWKGRPGLHSELKKVCQQIMTRQPTLIIALTGARAMQGLPIENSPMIQVFGQGPICEKFAAEFLTR